MKFIFAPDSFKGSLSALESCDILERVTMKIFPGTECVSVPVADGGEGTVDALLRAMGGQRMVAHVTGPMFERETAVWGLLSDGTAVMEMAQASGLPYVPADQKDPRKATSLGTGEMIAAAVKGGVRNILIGIGGSATNDGGMGMLAALGAKFTDAAGQEVQPIGGEMKNVARADFSGLMPELKETEITVICDVTNPLLGENGATFIYGPQKGATPEIRDELEAGMAHYAQVVSAAAGRDIASFPGAGAAGGLGAALGGVLGAQLKSGIDAVLDAVDFDKKLEGVDPGRDRRGPHRRPERALRQGARGRGQALRRQGHPDRGHRGRHRRRRGRAVRPVREHDHDHRVRPHEPGEGHGRRPGPVRVRRRRTGCSGPSGSACF